MARGKPLTIDQRATLEQLVLDGKTDEEVGSSLGISSESVIRYRKKAGLIKTGRGKLNVNPEKVSRTNINKDAVTPEQKEASWRAHLKQSTRHTRLNEVLQPNDLDYFEEQWATYHIQLEDMQPAEEDMLEHLIIHKIRVNENQRAFKEAQIHEQQLIRLLNGRTERQLDLENEQDRFMFDLIASNNRLKQEINRELKDLSDRYEKVQRALNATREQREQRTKVGADTFLSLVRMMNDRDRRSEIGKYNERMRVATEKQIEKLKKVHTFIDGTQEAILLDGSDFIQPIQPKKNVIQEGIDETKKNGKE